MKDTDKLFRVTCKGMQYSITGPAYGVSYVIAKDPSQAYERVRHFLDTEDLGYTSDRELEKVELIAENYMYTKTGTLFIIG